MKVNIPNLTILFLCHSLGVAPFSLLPLNVNAENLTADDENLVDEEQGLYSIYGDEELVSIATGISQPIAKAPAVASVITEKDILAMGATDLDEVLEAVPGLHVSFSPDSYNPIYTFRGIYTSYNSQVLMLINGIPLTHLVLGNRSLMWGGMPVKAISKIEVIRGPGSAIYGADAGAGVINIITKTQDEIKGTEVGAGVGSFDTQDAWVLHGNTYQDLDLVFTLEHHNTDGQRGIIESDQQTFYDRNLGTNASLAPGPVNLARESLDARLDLAYQHWRFRTGLQRRDMGTGAGVAHALYPGSPLDAERLTFDVTYHEPNIRENWDFTVQVSHLDSSTEIDGNLILFPPGADIGLGGIFPVGMIGNPETFEHHSRIDISTIFTGINKHTVRLGTGYRYEDLYKVHDSKNFGVDGDGNFLVPGSPVVDVSDTPYVYLQEGDRKNVFVFMQDIWTLAPDWDLTAGIRYDDYSDFGTTVNPRLALVWSSNYNLTTKVLYGRAFRAPAFGETLAQNNPVALGNPNLEPETIESTELAFDYDYSSNLNLIVSIFYYQWDDIIRFIDDTGGLSKTAQNTGQQAGTGVELEANWKINNKVWITGNFAHQGAESKKGAEEPYNAPQNQFYLRANWQINAAWRLTGQANQVMDRERLPSDVRSEIDDYTLVDLSLRNDSIIKNLDLALTIKNILDKAAYEPSSADIPNDLPLAERSVRSEVTYKF